MSNLKKSIEKLLARVRFSLAQMGIEEIEDGLTTDEEFRKLCRKAAAEGSVLLENKEFFPIGEESVAVFGRCQINTFYVGYGSGGDIRPPYRVSILDGLTGNGLKVDRQVADLYREWTAQNPPDDGFWGFWPTNYPEMPLSDEVIRDAASRNQKAIMVIGRAAGEDRESLPEKGSWYLTDEEKDILVRLKTHFSKVAVLMDCGSIMDMGFVKELDLDGLLYCWQGGQEMGNAVYDVISGRVSPCGKLTDTIAALEDYPSTAYFGQKEYNNYAEDIYVGYRYFESFAKDKVRYPFGYGLSYTTFSIEVDAVDDSLVSFHVTNTGSCCGKEVIQLYAKIPQGALGKPEVVLVDFVKTHNLKPGDVQSFTRKIDWSLLASYDDSGASGYRNAWVLEKGTYRFLLGTDIRNGKEIYSCAKNETVQIKQCREACAPEQPFDRMVRRDGKKEWEPVPVRTADKRERILADLPEEISFTGDQGYKLSDVREGKVTLDAFVAQLDDIELEAITRGTLEAMDSSLGPKGNAGVFAGTQESLRQKGIPALSTNDGPSGVRLQAHTTLMPSGVALASTFDVALIEKLTACLGKEVRDRKSMVLLAPGMNIHRNPLCGRNFEYFSEDPVLSGRIAAAYVRGVQSAGAAATVKHFACNNQETNRSKNDSRVSQRALREIYLKGFEICIAESDPCCVMTSYNKLNGEWNYNNYDLATEILRKEWGFTGCVMTDWWMVHTKCAYFTDVRDQAYRVRAQVDVFMPGAEKKGRYKGRVDGSIADALRSKEGITRAEVQRCAKNVLRLSMKF
jgi:beta-glucosidase